MKNKKRFRWEGYLFVLPMFLLLGIFTIYPMIYSLVLSFTDWNFLSGTGNMNFVGVSNYQKMIGDIWFSDSIKNTVYYTLMYVPLTILLSFFLAVILNEYVFLKKGLRLCYFVPYISSVAATSILWKVLYSPSGPIAGLIEKFGAEAPNFLADVNWAMPAVVLMSIWSSCGYCALIYVAGMQGISQDVYESASLDGARGFQKIFYLTFPLLSKTTFFLLVTQIINSFKVFGQIQIMTKGGPIRSTSVLAYYIYQSAFIDYKFGYASSMAMVLFTVILLVTLVQWKTQKYFEY